MAKFCSACGAQLPESAGFCKSCGKAFVQPQQAQGPELLYQPQQAQPVQAYAQQQYPPVAPQKKKSRLPLILGIAGGAVIAIIVAVILVINGAKAAINKAAQVDYYEIGSDKIPSVKLALGEERKITGIKTSAQNGVTMREITYEVSGTKQNEDMIAYMDYVREKDGFLILTDIDFTGPESWGGLGRNSVDKGYEILLQLDYNKTGYTITLVRQEGEVAPGMTPTPTPDPVPATPTPAPTPAVAAESVFELIDSGTFHMHGVVVGGEANGNEIEIFKKNGIAALVARGFGMVARSITKDGKTYSVMEEDKKVIVEEEDPEDMPPIAYASSQVTYVGEGSGEFNGKTYPYSEYTGVKGEGLFYFMEGGVLKAIRTITPTGNTVDIEIRVLEGNVQDSAFEWPQEYTVEEEVVEPWIGLWRYEGEDGLELIHLKADGTFLVVSRFGEPDGNNQYTGDYSSSEGNLALYNVLRNGEPTDDMKIPWHVEGNLLILGGEEDPSNYYRVPKEDEAAVLADPLAPYTNKNSAE